MQRVLRNAIPYAMQKFGTMDSGTFSWEQVCFSYSMQAVMGNRVTWRVWE